MRIITVMRCFIHSGVTYGNMLLSLPEDAAQQQKVFAWLDANRVIYSKEVG